jgi:hypothetical protein
MKVEVLCYCGGVGKMVYQQFSECGGLLYDVVLGGAGVAAGRFCAGGATAVAVV